MTQRSFYEHQFKVENKKVTRRQIFFSTNVRNHSLE